MSTWFQNPDFWRENYNRMFGNKMMEAADDEVDQIETLVGATGTVDVLDLCCGPGRHSLAFARRGHTVTGVDLTQEYLDTASKKAQAESLPVSFVHEDMRSFVRREAFDVVVNLFTSFGYFEDQGDDRTVLKNVFQSLRSGGSFVIDMMGKEILARIFTPRDWEEKDGELLLSERSVGDDWSWFTNRWIVIRDCRRHDFTFGHRVYSASELKSELFDAGFATVSIYGGLEGIPYDCAARRLVAVATK